MCEPTYFRCRWCGEMSSRTGKVEEEIFCEVCNREITTTDAGDHIEAAMQELGEERWSAEYTPGMN